MALLSSLRSRLLALVLVGVVPSLAIFVYAEWNHRQRLVHEVEENARDVAQLVAERHQRAVDRARGLLLGISSLPSLRQLDGKLCSSEIRSLLARAPLYSNVAGVAPDGTIFCSATPLKAPVNIADRAHFRGALERDEFTAGGYLRARARDGAASFGFAHPVHDDAGRIVAVAGAVVALEQLQNDLDALGLPGRVQVVVVDREGVVVTGHPAPGARVGTRLDSPLLALMGSPGYTEIDGSDGVRRIFAFRDVSGAGGQIAMRVAAGIPAEAAYAPVNRIVRRSVLAFLGVVLLAVAASAFGAEIFVVRRVRAVIAAARRIASGEHAARTGLPPSRGEIGELVHAFDDMASSLERLSRQNRLLLDAVGEGIVGIDGAGGITFVNPAAERALGWTTAEMLGKDSHALFHGRRADGTAMPPEECRFLAAMREHAPQQGTEEVLWRRDGTSFPVDYVCTPLVDAGRAVGVVLVFKDVSERRRLEERLRQAEKMEAIGQLAGGVAHDFNNLLTAIVSYAQLVRDHLPAGHESQPDLREIGIAAERATALTRQLLTFSRRQRVAPRVVELRAIVRGMETMLRRLLPANVSLRVGASSAGTVRADPAQVEMMVLNLAVNARDALPSGGRLEISVSEIEASAPREEGLPAGALSVLTVTDDGYGMDAATRERIFEPFFTTKPAGKGTGLGLSTVFGIVSQGGGAIRVRSEPGRGSEFRVLLPREARPEEGLPPAPVSPRPAPGVETVLLVEDDAAIRGIARRTLAAAGYRVLDAGSGGDALQIAQAVDGPIDILVSDVLLPGLDGWQLSRELLRLRPGVRLLFMSGYAAQVSGEALLPDGVPFLPKPFGPEDLLRAVRAALDGATSTPHADGRSAPAVAAANRRA